MTYKMLGIGLRLAPEHDEMSEVLVGRQAHDVRALASFSMPGMQTSTPALCYVFGAQQ